VNSAPQDWRIATPLGRERHPPHFQPKVIDLYDGEIRVTAPPTDLTTLLQIKTV
jgi:hypothetical protein